MLVVCPNCATSYSVHAASLRPAGRQVRCQRCRGVWRAELPHAEKLLAAADALAPTRRAIETVAEVVAEETAPAAKARSRGGDMADNEAGKKGLARYMGGNRAPNEAGQGGQMFAKFACEQALADALADAPRADAAEANPPAFALGAGGPLAISWPISPADVAIALPLEQFDTGQVEAERQKIADGLEAERAMTAQNDAAGAELVAGIATIVERRARRQWRGRPPASRLLQLAILALFIADAIIVGARVDLVRAMPQTASFFARLGLPVNLRGIEFAGVTATAEEHDGATVLVVSGAVSNTTGKTKAIPRLRFTIRNAARQEIYSWTARPQRTTLSAGEALTFHSRLPSPPPDTHEVLVSFADRANQQR